MKKLMGLFASVALLGSGVALAGDDLKNKDQQQQSQGATGGAGSAGQSDSSLGQDIGGSGQSGQVGQTGQQGQMGQSGQVGMGQQMGSNELTGRVVRSDRKTVWVEHAGAIVPLKINKETQFTDPNLKRAQDLKEGDEIRASFEVQKTDNIAKSIQKAGTGGSGQDVMSPDSSINQSPGSTLPPANDGIGGSGDLGGDIGSDINEQPGADTGEVLNPAPDNTRGDY